MFEYLYIERAIQTIEKYPKVAGIIAAYFLASEMQGNLAKVRMLKIETDKELLTAQTTLECEKIRLETARIEAENRASK